MPTAAEKFADHQLSKLETAKQRATANALEALNDPCTPCRVAEFYDPTTNYAGATFIQLERSHDKPITASDLIATTTLAVEIPVLAVRRFLEDRELQAELSALLSDLPKTGLEDVNDEGFERMCAFYDRVKENLAKAGTKSSNAWVTASKLTARKRPDLFPVRDSVVCNFLGISGLNDRELDWRVFQHLLSAEEIKTHLAALPQLAREASINESIHMDSENLRLLDAVLWRYAGGGGTSASRCPHSHS